METSPGKSTGEPSRKPEKQGSNIHYTQQRRAGTSKMPDEHPMAAARRDQADENEKKDPAMAPEEVTRKRRSTFDPKFKGWRGPVYEGSSFARQSCSDSNPSSPGLKKSSNRTSMSSSKNQTRPSSSSIVIDNNYYRSIVRRSITSSRQVPRVPIIPRNVSVPDIDWEGVVRMDSRDSCVHRRNAFEWERPDSADIHRHPRTRPHSQASSSSSAGVSASCASVSATIGEASLEDRPVNTEPTRQGTTEVLQVDHQRNIDEDRQMRSLIDEVMRLRNINSQLKEEIADFKKKDKHQPQ